MTSAERELLMLLAEEVIRLTAPAYNTGILNVANKILKDIELEQILCERDERDALHG